mmetsp:Transcript_20991/g.20122  ORF Transcript_20991/g.20122 Transcript_20991/m.20122 type:complete len:94 (+) Transcript_20991:1328-1609(+)
MGGSILWEEYYRFRHIGTGKYLSISNNLELQLKTLPDLSSLFKIKRDSFLQEEEGFREVKTGDNLILETTQSKFVQIYQDFRNEELNDQFEFK